MPTIAPGRPQLTVTDMPNLMNHPDRVCVEHLGALVRSQITGAPILLTSMLTLTQPFELFHPGTYVVDGELHVPAIEFNNMTTLARTVPLSQTAMAILCAHHREGAVRDLLCIPAAQTGPLVHRLRSQLLELELPEPLELEELWVPVMHALVCRGHDAIQRRSVLAYAGIPPSGVKAQRLRASADLTMVADGIDELCHHAGLATTTTAPQSHVHTG